ncbi:uncharacterized protein M421DRAFT_349029 [Didymella exigua CBS 183.55]|uniref:Uncharacterized protein n=1 Tax=Didymella exigua CBS 183.55 TaxID=1150837 RepID=A0A6A5R749_9PLEO|nr:uncharacterized protein M421DRAFT_349029 [Didymella exigua CBS 183.55]KAF1922794.1 hypothetical protein M421DRAFT_349029 [Didymella exigua CBS 183.55]
MVAHFTMQHLKLVLSTQHHGYQAQGCYSSPHNSPTTSMRSEARNSIMDLPLAAAFAADNITISHGGHASVYGDGNHDGAPVDGPKVWYCSECGDGPIGEWQVSCQNCGHAACGACTIEST